jgi:mediator of RNA polymerase II transcription subunit 7
MSGLSSVFPPPPKYYKYFTAENLEKLSNYEDAENKVDELPQPLQYLIPPKPPTDTYYRSFGNIWHPNQSDLQSLEDAGIKQLYNPITNSSDRIWELKKLLKSLLVNYIELTGIMSVTPEKFPEKVEDIRIILINMHHLLNEYRPHQSRESLALLMEEQISERRKQIDTLRTSNKEIKEKIRKMAKQFDDVLQPDKMESESTTNENGYFDESSYDPDDLRDKKNKQHDLDLIAKLQQTEI